MNYFFVDYENVKNMGLEGVEHLSPEDTVVIFYSMNANTITFDMHKKLNMSKANIVFEKVNVGKKNSLDFQLAAFMGYVIGRTEGCDAAYHLVTKDAELSVVGKFWQRKYKTISVIERIADMVAKSDSILDIPSAPVKGDVLPADIFAQAEASVQAAASVEIVDIEPDTVQADDAAQEPFDGELEMKLAAVLSDKTEIPVIVKIIKHYKTKQGINNALMKKFPSQNNHRSAEIYKAIKPLLTDKKGK